MHTVLPLNIGLNLIIIRRLDNPAVFFILNDIGDGVLLKVNGIPFQTDFIASSIFSKILPNFSPPFD